jgi:putative hydrolases of HD superfamily
MNREDIERRLSFIREAERLKSVLRSGYTSQGRPESTAEHSWRLCLLAMVFEDQFHDLNFGAILKMCVLHDLGEALNGDIPAVNRDSVPDKSGQERRDLETLMVRLPEELRAEFGSLWDEYENAATPEARVVKALDKIETLIQHNQGDNPRDFDYKFNLEYGRTYTDMHPLLAQVRSIVDEETRQRC